MCCCAEDMGISTFNETGISSAVLYYEPLAHYFHQVRRCARSFHLQALPLHTYALLGSTVVRPPQRPEKGEALRSVCMPLMGGKHMLSIFAMLLHRWVFHPKHQGKQGDEHGDDAERVQIMTKHVYVLLSGAHPDPARAFSQAF